MESIFHRRSIRRYTDEPVSPEDIEKIIKAGMAAPTACNDRQWEFYVVGSQPIKELLSEVSPYTGCARLAPVVLVVGYQKECGIAPEYAQINMAIVCENMLLEADFLGLGSVILGVAPNEEREAKVSKILNLPAEIVPFAILPVGHPAMQPSAMDKFDSSRIHFID